MKFSFFNSKLIDSCISVVIIFTVIICIMYYIYYAELKDIPCATASVVLTVFSAITIYIVSCLENTQLAQFS